MAVRSDMQRSIGLLGATGVGVGAIVGGGIPALAGVAFAATGPSAILGFAFNGLIALVTALSLAELATQFPESGGTYVFAERVLPVEAAFTVGWIVWFASIVAAVLYAFGFGVFAATVLDELSRTARGTPLACGHGLIAGLGCAATLMYTLGLLRSVGGGGSGSMSGRFSFSAS